MASCSASSEPLRAGPHDAHLPEQDVDELRELIQPRLSQELPDLRDAGIVLGRHDDPRQPLGVRTHRAELEHREFLKSWTRIRSHGTIRRGAELPRPSLSDEHLPGDSR